MTTNFTLRDFFSFLLVGTVLLFCVGLIFHNEIIEFFNKVYKEYDFIKEFTFLWTLLLITLIYFVGHLVGSIIYVIEQFYIHCIYKCSFFKKPRNKFKKLLFQVLRTILRKQDIDYAIKKACDEDNKFFKSTDDFYIRCAFLQKENCYSSAEYWNLLNEFSHSMSIVFFISFILALIVGMWILTVVYFSFSILFYFRSQQYAEYFVKTVIRKLEASPKDFSAYS